MDKLEDIRTRSERKERGGMSETRVRFAVVRDNDMNKVFSKWHTSADEAFEEAERLARKEPAGKFFVLKLVGIVTPEKIPVKTDRWDS